jgi:hypothetical protein
MRKRAWRVYVMRFLVLVIWFVGVLLPHQATSATAKKVSATAHERTRLGRNDIQGMIGDIEIIIGRLSNYLYVFTSADPAWHDTTTYTVEYMDPKTRDLKGYAIDVHADGDLTFRDFEGTFEDQGGGIVSQTQGWFLGGTGKFKGITGKWRMHTQGTGISTVSELEVEYQFKP